MHAHLHSYIVHLGYWTSNTPETLYYMFSYNTNSYTTDFSVSTDPKIVSPIENKFVTTWPCYKAVIFYSSLRQSYTEIRNKCRFCMNLVVWCSCRLLDVVYSTLKPGLPGLLWADVLPWDLVLLLACVLVGLVHPYPCSDPDHLSLDFPFPVHESMPSIQPPIVQPDGSQPTNNNTTSNPRPPLTQPNA